MSNKNDFKIGDRVIATEEYDDNTEIEGKVGTIIAIELAECAVYFDESFNGGHTLRGRCPDGHGWWCHYSVLELFEEKEEPNITISFDKVVG